MTICLSEMRRSVEYGELKAFAFAPADPDTINFEIGTDEQEELVEVECKVSGLKSVCYWDGPGQRVSVALDDPEFLGWSEGLRRKIAEALVELAAWELDLRKSGGAWDPLSLGPALADIRSQPLSSPSPSP
jgi:hypothetical protein